MFSKLTLGTAQLGFKYGINNKIGKPTKKVTLKILNFAYDHEITSFDTASVYGNSEKILGNFLKDKNYKFFITSKLKSLTESKISKNNVEKIVFKEIQKSLKKLNVKHIDNYLIHDFNDLTNFQRLINILRKAQEQNLIQNIGISIYNPKEVDIILNYDIFKSVQIPLNMFDQRFLKSDMLKNLKKNKFLIFSRSVFLQGLFFMKEQDLPANLSTLKNYLKIINEICEKYNISISTLAFDFLKKIKEIDSIIFGVESLDQLNNNIQSFTYKKLDIDYEIFNNIDENLINPSKW